MTEDVIFVRSFEDMGVAINIDGIGQALGTNTVSIAAGTDQLERTVTETLQKHPAMFMTEPWPASNHYTFYSHGVPRVVLGNVGGADITHRSKDTLAWLSKAKFDEVIKFVTDLILAL